MDAQFKCVYIGFTLSRCGVRLHVTRSQNQASIRVARLRSGWGAGRGVVGSVCVCVGGW